MSTQEFLFNFYFRMEKHIPDVIIIVDQTIEMTAIQEASILNIPIISILDTICDPDLVDIPIPGNDDATRAIAMYCRLVSESILDGLQVSFSDSGNDIGESDLLKEDLDSEKKADKPKDSNVSENEDKLEVKQNAALDENNKNICLLYTSPSPRDS